MIRPINLIYGLSHGKKIYIYIEREIIVQPSTINRIETVYLTLNKIPIRCKYMMYYLIMFAPDIG